MSSNAYKPPNAPPVEKVLEMDFKQLATLLNWFLADEPEDEASWLAARINGKNFVLCPDMWPPHANLSWRTKSLVEKCAERYNEEYTANTSSHADAQKRGISDDTDIDSPNVKRRSLVPNTRDEILQPYSALRALLWEQDENHRSSIYVTKNIPTYPLVSERASEEAETDENSDDSSEEEPDGKYSATFLSLEPIMEGSYFVDRAGAPQAFEDSGASLPAGTLKMLVRSSYIELLKLLEKEDEDQGLHTLDPFDKKRRTKWDLASVVTGQPGIGKTWFGSYLLVERLLRGLPTVLQVARDLATGDSSTIDHIVFSSEGARWMSNVPLDDPVRTDNRVWAIIDRKPAGGLWQKTSGYWRMIVTTSPKDENTKYMDKLVSPSYYVMPPWRWDEILAQAFDSGITVPQISSLREIFEQFGPVPRLIFDDINPKCGGRVLTMMQDKVAKKFKQKVQAFVNLRDPEEATRLHVAENDSHSVMLLIPQKPLKLAHEFEEIGTTWELTFRSPWITRMVANEACSKSETRGRWLYKWMAARPYTAAAAGWFFEERVHNDFQTPTKVKGTLLTPVEQLEDSYTSFMPTQHTAAVGQATNAQKQADLAQTLSIQFKDAPFDRTVSFSNHKKLGALVRAKSGSTEFDKALSCVYLRPIQSNMAAADGFVFISDNGHPRPIFFQMTIAEKHPISAVHLHNMWMSLPAAGKKLIPAFVWVVPQVRAKNYSNHKHFSNNTETDEQKSGDPGEEGSGVVAATAGGVCAEDMEVEDSEKLVKGKGKGATEKAAGKTLGTKKADGKKKAPKISQPIPPNEDPNLWPQFLFVYTDDRMWGSHTTTSHGERRFFSDSALSPLKTRRKSRAE